MVVGALGGMEDRVRRGDRVAMGDRAGMVAREGMVERVVSGLGLSKVDERFSVHPSGRLDSKQSQRGGS